MSEQQQKHEVNRSFYDRISHSYDFIADAGEHHARVQGETALDVQPGEKVLEIGFGTGNSLIHLAEKVGPTGKVCGIDVSSGMQAVTERKLAAKGLADRVELKVGDARKLPWGDGEFDAAFMSFTLELFPLEDIPAVLKEIHRVLKVGGRVGNVSMAKVKEGEKASVLEKTYIWMHQHFPHIVDCQPIAVAESVKNAGFTIDKELDMTIWTMPVVAVVGKK